MWAVSLFLAILIVSPTRQSSASIDWKDYKVKYGKNYGTWIEDFRHEMIFQSRIQQIEAHNRRYEQGFESFERGVNNFTDMTHAERRIFTNYRRETQNYKNLDNVVRFERTKESPKAINWVKRGAVTPIKNQGTCGSCYTFGSVVALEAQYFLNHGELRNLSEQNLLDCSENNFGCAGGFSNHCFEYVQEKRIMAAEDYPYEGVQNNCRFDAEKSVFSIVGFKSVESGDEDQLVRALDRIGPITVALDARHFFDYKKGILDDTSGCNGTDHIIAIVGMGTDRGVDYYLGKNSWGHHWGEDGFIRIKRGINYCSIADWAEFPEV